MDYIYMTIVTIDPRLCPSGLYQTLTSGSLQENLILILHVALDIINVFFSFLEVPLLWFLFPCVSECLPLECGYDNTV